MAVYSDDSLLYMSKPDHRGFLSGVIPVKTPGAQDGCSSVGTPRISDNDPINVGKRKALEKRTNISNFRGYECDLKS